jgi:hypothetical protein
MKRAVVETVAMIYQKNIHVFKGMQDDMAPQKACHCLFFQTMHRTQQFISNSEYCEFIHLTI